MYDDAFFETIRAGCKASAAVVVPLVLEHVQPRTVVDVGCGEGWWGKAFQDAGCDVRGVDGDYADPVIPWVPVDLTAVGQAQRPRRRPGGDYGIGTVDLAVCIEVAEHLPPGAADGLIASLCSLAPIVLFSAAIPGQGGTGHVNEQWPSYWVDRFERHGYACSGALRWAVWTDDRVENWYRQNLMVAASDPARLPKLFDTPLAPMWPVVHPVLYDARRP